MTLIPAHNATVKLIDPPKPSVWTEVDLRIHIRRSGFLRRGKALVLLQFFGHEGNGVIHRTWLVDDNGKRVTEHGELASRLHISEWIHRCNDHTSGSGWTPCSAEISYG